MLVSALREIIIFYVFWSIDTTVISNLSLGWFRPDFMFAAYIVMALGWSEKKSVVVGILLGSLIDSYGPGNYVFYTIMMPVMGVFFGIHNRDRPGDSGVAAATGYVLLGVLISDVCGLIYFLFVSGYFFVQRDAAYVLLHLVSNLIIAGPVWLVCRKLMKKEEAYAV